MSTSTTTTQLHQHLITDIHYSRRLLHTAAAAPPQTLIDQNHHSNSSDPYATSNSFDANVIMVLSVLLCALICSLGLNSIIKCALRCSTNFVDSSSTSNNNTSARLANTGVKRKALKTFPTVSYSADLKLPGLDSECVICLSEFSSGDKVRLLPKCNHGFHVRCIDKWLGSHSSCPTCRHCLIETCHKIVGSSSSSEPAHPPPAQETMVTIAPLEPEGLMRNYR